MPCQLICPNLRCRKILNVPEEARGKVVKCQYCQTMLRVPPARHAPTNPAAVAGSIKPASTGSPAPLPKAV